MRLVPGDRFGPYVIQAELGRGGQAIVYRAQQEGLERHVALKVFDISAPADPAAADRFQREAVAAARVEHPRIVPVYDAGMVDGKPFIAMRLIDGLSLAEEITRRGPVRADRATGLLDDIAQALDYAHAKGLTHRDLKPANILLDGEGAAYLSDFGVARLNDRPGLTRPGDWLGTAEYLSPEQIEGHSATAASDIYSFACLAYEVLTGRPPFVRREPTAVLLAQARDAVPAAHDFNPDLPVAADQVLESGLSKRPEDRPRSAQSFVTELRTALGSATSRITVVGASPVPRLSARDPWNSVLGRFTRGSAPTSAAQENTSIQLESVASDPGGRGKTLRGRWLAIAGVTAIVAAGGLAVGGWAFGQSQADAGSARAEGVANGRQAGFVAGHQAGLVEGQAQGFGRGKTIGLRLGYKTGYKKGHQTGHKEGMEEGRSIGYELGYSEGHSTGRQSIFDTFSSPFQVGRTYLVTTGQDGDGLYLQYKSDNPIPDGACLYSNGNSSATGC